MINFPELHVLQFFKKIYVDSPAISWHLSTRWHLGALLQLALVPVSTRISPWERSLCFTDYRSFFLPVRPIPHLPFRRSWRSLDRIEFTAPSSAYVTSALRGCGARGALLALAIGLLANEAKSRWLARWRRHLWRLEAGGVYCLF